MTVKPNPGPAHVAMVSIGPPITNRWCVVPPQSITGLPRVPVVAVDFYPLRPSQAARLSRNNRNQEALIHGT